MRADVNVRKAHTISIEQCDAAQTIKARFGLTAAFDYLVGEKLMNFAIAASRHPDFARELPRFVSEVRHMFTPDEIGAHLAQIERSQTKRTLMFWRRGMIFFVRVRPQPRSASSSSCWSRDYCPRPCLVHRDRIPDSEVLCDVARGSPPKSRIFPVGS